ncbi:MAG: hypothetical protein KatS3mg113_0073 [Planctomycetaceae bacterium]|nr:MAG: hypothetical protein KatS3mg113_0073 [Planctomycetaceae bacterium]
MSRRPKPHTPGEPPALWSLPHSEAVWNVHAAQREKSAVHVIGWHWPTYAELLTQHVDELSIEERHRANRCVLPTNRKRFITCRVVLRLILAEWMGIEPHSVTFAYQRQGKPYLQPETHPRAVHFSLAHAGDWGILALRERGEIGVDVERHEQRTALQPDTVALVRGWFASEEFEQWLSLPISWQTTAFYRLWTGKEACLKMLGWGLNRGMKQPVLCADPRRPWRVLDSQGTSIRADAWQLHPLPVAADYTAAVAWLGTNQPVRLWIWHG